MRMFNPHFVLVSAVGLLSAASCTLITDVDRKKIPPPDTSSPEGGQGATGGSAGRGGSGGTGGSSGGAGEAGESASGGSSGETGGAGEAGAAGTTAGTGGAGGSTGGGAGEAGSGGAGGVVPVCTKASGTISLDTDPHTFFQDGDRFTLGDGVNDAVTFEFDCFGGTVCNPDDTGPSNGTEGVGAGRTAIVFDGTEDEAGMADLIVTAINGANLRIAASLASSDDGSAGAGGEAGSAPAKPGEPLVIELANGLFGDRTNVRITDRVANGNFTVSGMSGGEAVSCAALVTACSDDDACESASCDTSTNLCD